MKAVLMSIKPFYCFSIAKLLKQWELRKSRPKIHTPFKVYIYCTKPKERFSLGSHIYAFSDMLYRADGVIKYGSGFEEAVVKTTFFNGKIIGEYICDKIIEWDEDDKPPVPLSEIGLTYPQVRKYAPDGMLYLWHISGLIIYDEPKEISEFAKASFPTRKQILKEHNDYATLCDYCPDTDYGEIGNSGVPDDFQCSGNSCEAACDTYIEKKKWLSRPPQSWCYVEDNG